MASRGACRTVASAACGAYIAQAALIGDDMAKQIMQAYTGQAALSPLTQALVNSGLSEQDAKATMFLINMGVVELTIVQGIGQLRPTSAARAGSAEQVAQIEQQTAKLNQALINSEKGTAGATASKGNAAEKSPSGKASAEEPAPNGEKTSAAAAEGRVVDCILCFAAGTPVKTEAGYEPIESLKAGSLIPSEDPKTGAISLRRVMQVLVRPHR